ncbi:MAG: metalloregulator ArsR/SmtB family transcription factor [Clostridia bacterium]|nr:metalloregulator ArsR/SmtB family transcription factor [Clostridia bacterium]MDD4375825.1 metalloregulator ArsR/SmtB family transcription factor [Clostridia bacterium]
MEKYQLYEKKAQILKVLAHPIRLCIVKGLIKEECNVSSMQGCIKSSQSNISQHLAKLKSAGIVKTEKRGLEVFYYIDDEEIKELIKMI